MGFEKELERVLSRRKFLAGLGLTVGSVSLAKLALLQTKAEELARQPDAPGVTGFGSGPGDADSFARLVNGNRGDILRRNASAWERLALGSSSQYLRSDGTDPAWSALQAADIPQHRHTPASGLQSLNQSQVNVTNDTVVNSIAFTPETAPYTFRMLWQFHYNGTDNDLDGVINQAFTLAIVTGGVSKDTFTLYIPGAGALQWGTLFTYGRGTTTAARTFNTRTRELANGAPRDTVEIGSSDLTVLVVYERSIAV